MWNKMKLAAKIRIAYRRERERERGREREREREREWRSQIACPYVRVSCGYP
jgi:protein subunit release factor B